MIGPNLAALQVILPLVGAPICTLFGGGSRAWIISTALTWCAFAISVALMLEVRCCGTISYVMGGWLAPWGIEYRVDPLSALMLLLITGVAAAAMPFAYSSVMRELPKEKHRLFYTAYLLALTGLIGMAITGDAFNAFVFMEIASLSAYVLISLGKNRQALYASFQYLVLGTIGATFFVIGVGLLYMLTGTLNMIDLSERLSNLENNRVLFAAFSFLVVGLSLKLALFPLHLWLPNSYAHAPSIVSVLLAATGTKIAAYLLLRFSITVLRVNEHDDLLSIMNFLFPLAVIAMFAGSVVAIYQSDVKCLLAYSSVAQIGYIVLGISLTSERALTGSMLHIFNHGIMKAALFASVGAMALTLNNVSLPNLKGIGKRMPLTMAAFTISALSLIGIPGTVGFISKWYLVLAAVETGSTKGMIAASAVIGTSLLAIIYVWRILEIAYSSDLSETDHTIQEAPWPTLLSLWILAVSCIVLGLFANVLIEPARIAAQMLLSSN